MKSYKNIRNLSLLFLAIFMSNSCTKDFIDLNTAPDLITENLVTPELLLTGVEVNIGGGLNYGNASEYCGMTTAVDDAPFDDRFDDSAWGAAYTSLGNNLAAIIRKTANKPDLVNKKAIRQLLRSNYCYRRIYLDVPALTCSGVLSGRRPYAA